MARVSSYLDTRTEGNSYAYHDLSAKRGTWVGKTPVTADSAGAARLIQQVAKQDRDAFSELYDRFSTLVFTLAMRMLKARSDAEDLLQQVFVEIWRRAHVYSVEHGSPEAWIINIARSRAIDKIRSIRRMERSSFVPTNDAVLKRSCENI